MKRIAVVGLALALSGAAGAQTAPGWRGERRTATIYEASLSNSSGFLLFRCTITSGTRGMGPQPELSITAGFRDGPLKRSFDTATITADEASLSLRSISSPTDYGVMLYQWRADAPGQIDGPGRTFVGEAWGRQITVRAPSGEQEIFPSNGEARALGDIMRCSSASIQAAQYAAALTPNQLLPMWGMADEGCRGGFPPGNAPDCDKRAAFSERLRQLGWCFGRRDSQIAANMRWHRCDAGSLR